MAFVLAVTWTAKPGNEARVREILEEMGEASRAEPGVITYTTHVDPENPREFFIYEKYHDADGLAAHQETEHFQRLVLQEAISCSKRACVGSLPTFDSTRTVPVTEWTKGVRDPGWSAAGRRSCAPPARSRR